MSDIYGWQDYIYNYTKRPSMYNSTSNPSSAMYDEALAQVQSIGSTFSNTPENKTAPQRIQDALSFLQTAISIERSKEANFLIMLQKEIKQNFSKDDQTRLNEYIDISNWKLFIKELQLIMGKQNKTIINARQLVGEMNNNVTKIEQSFNTKELSSKTIDRTLKHFDSQKLFKIIRDAILSNQEVLISLKEVQNENELQKKIQAIILNGINNWAQTSTNLTEEDFQLEIKNYITDINAFESIETLDELTNRLSVLADKIPKADALRKDMTKAVKTRNKAERDYNRYIKEQEQLINTKNLFKSLGNSLDDQIAKSVALIKAKTDFQQQDFIAEVQGAVTHAIQNTFAAGIQLGQQYAKPDVLIGHISTEFKQATDELSKSIHEQYKQEMLEYLQSYSKNMTRTNTYEYYKQRANEIRNITIPDNFQDLSNWFVIEESTKAYEQVQAGKSKSFTGGSLGPNLIDQLKKITTIISSLDKGSLITDISEKIANSTMNDLAWFLVNTIQDLIAKDYQQKLLLYLSAFVTIFLFDDQLLIWEDVLKTKFDPNYISDTHRLHLFALNQEYYPLSLILQAVHDRIAKNFEGNQIDDTLVSSGATIVLENVPGIKTRGPNNYYHIAGIPQQLAQKISLKVEFLNNFQELINALYQQI